MKVRQIIFSSFLITYVICVMLACGACSVCHLSYKMKREGAAGKTT